MKSFSRCFVMMLAVFFVSACDLQPHIVSVFDESKPVQNAKSSKNEYGTPPAGIDTMYGHTDSASVYGRPASDNYGKYEQNRTASSPSVINKPAESKEEFVVNDNGGEDILLVPEKAEKSRQPPTIQAPATEEITIQKGDTLYSIAKNYNVPLRDLADYNNVSAPYNLIIGQILKIPGTRMHTVAAGDTLYSVSRRYSVDLNSLAETNGIKAPYSLSVGQKLSLPATIKETSAVPNVMPRVSSIPATGKPLFAGGNKVAMSSVSAGGAKPIVNVPKIGSDGKISKLPAVSARSSTKFSWPVRGKIISGFGTKKNGLYNDGINISASQGTSVKAAENGVVAYAGNELKGMGNLVIIQHSGGWMTVYAHMDTLSVKRGNKISIGEQIGTVGQTGKVSQPQLHFEIRKGTKAYNPTANMKK